MHCFLQRKASAPTLQTLAKVGMGRHAAFNPFIIQTAIFSKQPRKTVLLTDTWHDALEFRGEQLSLLFSGAHYSSDGWY